MRPNVVLVVCDTARADAFEPYGASSGASPAVADLARAGRAVPVAVAPANWTLPSHASMFTGLLPRELGLGQAPGGRPANCRPFIEAQVDRYLPAVLQRAGYVTRAVSTNLWVSTQSGFGTGFDEFRELVSGREERLNANAGRANVRWTLDALKADLDDGAAAAERVMCRWLDDDVEQPFFWFANLVECHSPYLPPRPYNDLSPIRRVRAARDARRFLNLSEIWRASAGGFDVPEPTLAVMRHLYGRAVRLMDDWIDRLVSRLDHAGLLRDTIVIVTSDHGENLGEGCRMGHAFWLDDRLIRVPFVWHGPGSADIPRVMSLADVPRLVASAVGLEEHPWKESRGTVQGCAVAQLDPLSTAADARIADALDLWSLAGDAARYARWRLSTASTAATDGGLKLVREGDVDWLYDLGCDPLEERPTRLNGHLPADVDAERVGRLRAALATAVQPNAGPRWSGEELPDARDHIEDRMRLLGYL